MLLVLAGFSHKGELHIFYFYFSDVKKSAEENKLKNLDWMLLFPTDPANYIGGLDNCLFTVDNIM